MVKVKQAALSLSSGSKSSITQEIATDIENVYKFLDFYNPLAISDL